MINTQRKMFYENLLERLEQARKVYTPEEFREIVDPLVRAIKKAHDFHIKTVTNEKENPRLSD